MKRPCLAAALWCLLGTTSTASWAVDTVAQAAQDETIVVRASLNTEEKGDLFVVRTAQRDFLVKIADLRAMGFRDPSGTAALVEGEPALSLRSMRGVTFDFQEPALLLAITAAPQLLATQTFGAKPPRQAATAPAPSQPSFFANYAIHTARTGTGSAAPGFAGELGWRSGNFLWLSDGSTVTDGLTGKRRLVRLMSSVTHDDREGLRRTVLGDFFTPSREFTSGISLGGISVSKAFGLDPAFVQFPLHNITGNVALPSDLELFVDGQRVRTERLKPGEFDLRDIRNQGGARNVQLVLRDAFGREQQFDYSLYFSDQPLRQGLHDYSYNLGAIRRGYGVESNHYGPPAFSLFHRYGATNSITLGARAEGTKDLFNAGPVATVVLGGRGVLSLAAAASVIAGARGAAGSLAYSYQSKSWSAGLSARREWNRFVTLADPPLASNRKLEASASASYYFGRGATVSIAHSLLTTRPGEAASAPSAQQPYRVTLLENQRRTTLSYSTPLVPGRASLAASLAHIKDARNGSRNEASVRLNVFFDNDYSAAAHYRRDAKANSHSLEFTKRQPVGEGLGFNLVAERTTGSPDSARLRSSVQYNARAAILRADAGTDRDAAGKTFEDYRVAVSGGIGYVDGTWSLGRPITGSFGIVKVGELAGVGVFVNGLRIGQTDARGRIFVPTLGAHTDNDISLAAETIPIDYSVPVVSKKISPASRSGTAIHFAATRLQAFTGKLKLAKNGVLTPVEFMQMKLHADEAQRFQTGRGGEFYLENLKPGTYPGEVSVDGTPCVFELVIPKSSETFVDVGDLVCRLGP